MDLICHHCGHAILLDHKIGREELCGECSSYLHCCQNCFFYSPLAYRQCRETEIEWVEDKATGNFCDYFKPTDKRPAHDNKRAEARKKLDDFFKKTD